MSAVRTPPKRCVPPRGLTQLSDVEDEINGLVTYDRQVIKLDVERMRGIVCRLTVIFDNEVKTCQS